MDDYAIWSKDGNSLYFTSSRDGFACLRASASRSATFHGRLRFDHKGFTLANGRIAMPLVEKTGGIWMMSRLNETAAARR